MVHRTLGTRERHTLAETTYAVLRQRLLLQHLAALGSSAGGKGGAKSAGKSPGKASGKGGGTGRGVEVSCLGMQSTARKVRNPH